MSIFSSQNLLIHKINYDVAHFFDEWKESFHWSFKISLKRGQSQRQSKLILPATRMLGSSRTCSHREGLAENVSSPLILYILSTILALLSTI